MDGTRFENRFCEYLEHRTLPLTAENLRGFATASWAKDGRGFMVIGAAPAQRIEALARALRERL